MIYAIGLLAIALVISVETSRMRRREPLNLMSGFNAAFILAFALPPFVILALPHMDPGGEVSQRKLWLLPVIANMKLGEPQFLAAGLWSLVGYASTAGAYFSLGRIAPRLPSLPEASLPRHLLMAAGLAAAALGLVALAGYARSIGGWENLARMAIAFRSGSAIATLGFLSYVAFFVFPASLLLWGAAIRFEGQAKRGLQVAAVLLWTLGLMLMLHRAGRLDTLCYLAVVPVAAYLAGWLRGWKLHLTLATAAAGGFAVAAFGYAAFSLDLNWLNTVVQQVHQHAPVFAVNVVMEFAFPYVVLAHMLDAVPDQFPFRYFADLPLALQYLAPNMGSADALPPTANMLTVRMFANASPLGNFSMPIDLLSFGHFSLGPIGVVVTAAAFGLLMRLADSAFDPQHGTLSCLMRAVWMTWLPFRLIYGDPYNAVKTGFGVLVATGLVGLVWVLASRRRRVT